MATLVRRLNLNAKHLLGGSAAFALTVLIPAVVYAQNGTFYVSVAGNDANPGTLSAPWRTVAKAANTLTAGQTALIRGGTYRESRITFAHSGVSNQRITLKAYTGEVPIVDGGFTTYAPNNPIFWIEGVSHLTIDGLTIRRGQSRNIQIGNASGYTGDIVIENSILEDIVTGDNAAHVLVNGPGGTVTIRNNVMRGRQQVDPYPYLSAGVQAFDMNATLVVEGNDISNVATGIYYKHGASVSGVIRRVRNNRIHDTTNDGILWSTRDAFIEHNVIYRTGAAGIHLFSESSTCARLDTTANVIRHNTLLDTAVGINLQRSPSCIGAQDTAITDNLIYNFTDGDHRGLSVWPWHSGTDNSRTVFRNNLLFSNSVNPGVRVINSYFDVRSMPSSIQTSANIAARPTFINQAGGDYRLAAGSPGKGAASDGTDMGAMNCTDGCTQAQPSAPRNLRLTPQ